VAGDLERDLQAVLGDDYRARIAATCPSALQPIPRRALLRPFAFPMAGVRVEREVAYGDGGRRHLLDVYVSADVPESQPIARPIAVYLHGGAWTIGNRDQQGKPLLLHLARCGFVAVPPTIASPRGTGGRRRSSTSSEPSPTCASMPPTGAAIPASSLSPDRRLGAISPRSARSCRQGRRGDRRATAP
jgi:hypothetical protein